MKNVFLIGLMVCARLSLYAFDGIEYQCDGAKLSQRTQGTWMFQIDNSDAGNHAKGFILDSANKKAYQAGGETKPSADETTHGSHKMESMCFTRPRHMEMTSLAPAISKRDEQC